MELIKKLTAISVSLGMMLLFSGAASAGPDVSISISNSNSVGVENDVFNGAFTGGNDIIAEDDVEGGTIQTGDATADGSVNNDVNQNETEVELNDDTEGDIEISQFNEAGIGNGVGNIADTGLNTIESEDEDVEGGMIDTGNAAATVDVDNSGSAINSNSTSLDASGADDLDVTIENDNDLDLENGVENGAFTGENDITAHHDVEGGEINSGDADADVDVNNHPNDNAVDLDLSDSDDVTVGVSQSNSAGIGNGVGNIADTGLNTIESEDEDVEGGEINTGDADADTSIVNAGSPINANRTTIDGNGADDFDIEIDHFNELGVGNGTFNGAFTGDNDVTAEDDVEGGEINTGDADADVGVQTQGNENEADLDISDSDDVEGGIEQDNDGDADTELINVADTGANSLDAEDEVQDGEVNTGDATSSENVVTTLNRNVVRFR